jgi:hypothetical protein
VDLFWDNYYGVELAGALGLFVSASSGLLDLTKGKKLLETKRQKLLKMSF